MSIAGDKCNDEYSVIGDKGEIGFIDFEDDKSVCSYVPTDEGDVVISVPFPFVEQKPQSVSVDEVAADAITIRNTTRDSVELWGIQIYASNPEDSFTLSLMDPSSKGYVGASSLEDRVLQPLKTLTIWLSCRPKDIGLHTCIVHFDVGDDKIERVVFLLAEDTISQSLASTKPYQRGRRRKTQFDLDSYVDGVRPSRATNRSFVYKLPFYKIPKDKREVLENKQVPDAILKGLSRYNYVDYFKTLLIMEELRLEEDIRAYDMEEATLRSRGRQYLILEVLGLAERRPSLVHGDSVFARLGKVDAGDTPVYEDPYWEQLLWRCVDNESYEGCALPQRQESYRTAEQECFEVSGQDQVRSWIEQGQDCPWEEYKPVGDGQDCPWEEDKPVEDGQDCPWDDFKPVEDNNYSQDCSWKEDQPVKDEDNSQNCAWEEFKPVKDEDEWSEGWK